LLSNAVRFTQDGFITITIEPDMIKNIVLISVADTGIGMVIF